MVIHTKTNMPDSPQSEKIHTILHKWQLEGKNTVQIAPGGMPQHPEFIYRLPVYGGEWPGWNAFLGIQMDENPEAFQKNIEQDEIENEAYALYVDMGSPEEWWE